MEFTSKINLENYEKNRPVTLDWFKEIAIPQMLVPERIINEALNDLKVTLLREENIIMNDNHVFQKQEMVYLMHKIWLLAKENPLNSSEVSITITNNYNYSKEPSEEKGRNSSLLIMFFLSAVLNSFGGELGKDIYEHHREIFKEQTQSVEVINISENSPVELYFNTKNLNESILLYQENLSLEIISINGDWYQVSFDTGEISGIGFVRKKQLIDDSKTKKYCD